MPTATQFRAPATSLPPRISSTALHSRLFRVRDDNAIATLADDWHRALIGKGFEDLPVESDTT